MPRPDEAVYQSFVSHLETSLNRYAAANPSPGRPDTLRRLNRTEYQNAVRDLLDLEADVAAILPSDDSSYGFDNISVGGLSPTLLERYLGASQKISRLAVGTPVRAPGEETIVLPADLTQEDYFDGQIFGTRAGASVRYVFPVDGEYGFRLHLTQGSQRAHRRADRASSTRGQHRRRTAAALYREPDAGMSGPRTGSG